MEVRQLADVGDVAAVQLECQQDGCDGIVVLKLDSQAIGRRDVMKCPVCGMALWDRSRRTPEQQLVEALSNARFPPRDRPGSIPPVVRLVLPA